MIIISGTSRKYPQTAETIIAEQTAKRSKIYKEASHELSATEIANIVSQAAGEMAEIAQGKEKIHLADAPALKEATLKFLDCCVKTSTLPTVSGLSRSLGHTSASVYDYMRRNADSQSGIWLAMFKDLCSDCLEKSALTNNINTIMAIFIQKSRYGLQEHNELTINAGNHDPLGSVIDPAEIAQKYSYLPMAEPPEWI